ncbi:LOW QUALITY PROTEIN: uncharacterized protein LOC129410857, partial [Boleophthalmus pectinirostris]
MSVKHRRRIITEDPDWSLEQVPYLSKLCLQEIIKNIEVLPIYGELGPSEQKFIQEKLPPNAPLTVTANLIPDGVYWERRSKELWDNCDVSYHGQSWKRLFFERYLEGLIEAFIPGETKLKTILEMVPLCKDYVKGLDIKELLLPIKTLQKKEEEEEHSKLGSIHDEEDKPFLDHFNFNVLLEKLDNLEELHLVYRVKQCGINYQKDMFRMTQRDCETLAQAVKSCKTLKVLHLYHSMVDDTQCRLLVEHLLDHPSLTKLDLSFNCIEDRGARAIGKLLTQSKLKTLKLYNTMIRDHGAKAIAHGLSTNTTLEELNLSLNRVGDEGGEAIATALVNNSSLKTLDLGGNEVGELTAIALSKVLIQNPTLTRISLLFCKLGVEGGKALREAMSNNSTVLRFVLDCTDIEEDDMDFINEVVWANEERVSLKSRPKLYQSVEECSTKFISREQSTEADAFVELSTQFLYINRKMFRRLICCAQDVQVLNPDDIENSCEPPKTTGCLSWLRCLLKKKKAQSPSEKEASKSSRPLRFWRKRNKVCPFPIEEPDPTPKARTPVQARVAESTKPSCVQTGGKVSPDEVTKEQNCPPSVFKCLGFNQQKCPNPPKPVPCQTVTVNLARFGLPNIGNTCYINASVQSIMTLELFMVSVSSQKRVWVKSRDAGLLRHLYSIQKWRYSTQEDKRNTLMRSFKALVASKAPEFTGSQQQDPHAFLTALFSQIQSLAPTLQRIALSLGTTYRCPVQELIFNMDQTRTCQRCGMGSRHTEIFNSVSLNLRKDATAQDLLDDYLKATDLEYMCGCGEQMSSVQNSFSTLPEVLMLHLKRVRFTPSYQLEKFNDAVYLNRDLVVSSDN